MELSRYTFAAALLSVAMLTILSAGCGDSSAPASEQTGAIKITVATNSAGGDIDPDGYSLSLDDGPGQVIAVDAEMSLSGLPIGRHLVRLDGLAVNCAVDGYNPISVDVTSGTSPTPARFSVTCGPPPSTCPCPWDY
jgi:hypothetical protein